MSVLSARCGAVRNAQCSAAQRPSVGQPDRSRRILAVAYDFLPSIEIGAHACAQTLGYVSQHGWQPVVLTAHERYIERRGVFDTARFPGPIVRTLVFPHPLDVYRMIGSRVRRRSDGPGSPNVDTSSRPSRREAFLSLLVLPDSAMGWIGPAVFTGLATIKRQGVTRIFSSGPAWTNHIVALVLAKCTGLPWIAQFRDPWVTGQPWPSPGRTAQRIHKTLEASVIKGASRVLCVTEPHSTLLKQTYVTVSPAKFVTIPNGFDEVEWASLDQCAADKREFTILYAGTLYGSRNPQPVLRALGELVNARSVDVRDVKIKFVGWDTTVGGRSITDLPGCSALNARIEMTGPVDRSVALEHMRRASVLLLLAEDLTLQIPGKTYEYLRAGRPILAVTPRAGAVAQLLRSTGGAWIVEPGDEQGTAAALRDAYSTWQRGERGPTADQTVVAKFDRRVLARQFADVFERSGD